MVRATFISGKVSTYVTNNAIVLFSYNILIANIYKSTFIRLFN